MLSRFGWRGVTAFFIAFALLLSSCSGDNGQAGDGPVETSAAGQPGNTPGEPPDGGPSMVDSGPDKPIDVDAVLNENGFAARFSKIEINAAYLLVPFATPAELELDGAETTTCVFNMVRTDYESGPVAQYPFSTQNNVAELTARQVNPDGSLGADLPQTHDMIVTELTPESLKEAFAEALPRCGYTEIR